MPVELSPSKASGQIPHSSPGKKTFRWKKMPCLGTLGHTSSPRWRLSSYDWKKNNKNIMLAELLLKSPLKSPLCFAQRGYRVSSLVILQWLSNLRCPRESVLTGIWYADVRNSSALYDFFAVVHHLPVHVYKKGKRVSPFQMVKKQRLYLNSTVCQDPSSYSPKRRYFLLLWNG